MNAKNIRNHESEESTEIPLKMRQRLQSRFRADRARVRGDRLQKTLQAADLAEKEWNLRVLELDALQHDLSSELHELRAIKDQLKVEAQRGEERKRALEKHLQKERIISDSGSSKVRGQASKVNTDAIKLEVFSGVQGALEIEKPKLLNYIRNRYGVSSQVVEEQFYDACQKLWVLYSDDSFVIEYTVIADGILTTSHKVITPNGYCVEAKQLAKARSWVWTSVGFKAHNYNDVLKNNVPADMRQRLQEKFRADRANLRAERIQLESELTTEREEIKAEGNALELYLKSTSDQVRNLFKSIGEVAYCQRVESIQKALQVMRENLDICDDPSFGEFIEEDVSPYEDSFQDVDFAQQRDGMIDIEADAQNIGMYASHSGKLIKNKVGIAYTKVEIFQYLVNYLEIDKLKRIQDIYFRYGISKQIVEELFYDACIEVGKRYCRDVLAIKYTSTTHNSQKAIVTSGKVITPSGYRINAKQLFQVRSWVWKNVDYQIMDFFKKTAKSSEVAFGTVENSLALASELNPEYIEIETIVDEEIESDAHIIVSVILSLSSDRERDVINLSFYSNMTNAEIAKHLDITPANVSSTKSRALMRIRAGLAVYPELQRFFDLND